MFPKPVNLRYTNSIWKYFINFIFIDKLTLALRNGLFFRYTLFLFSFRRLKQIFDFHCVHEVFSSATTWLHYLRAHMAWTLMGWFLYNIYTRPYFSKSTRPKFFLAEVLASNTIFILCLWNRHLALWCKLLTLNKTLSGQLRIHCREIYSRFIMPQLIITLNQSSGFRWYSTNTKLILIRVRWFSPS